MIALGNRRPFVAQPAWRPASIHGRMGQPSQYDLVVAAKAYKASVASAEATTQRLSRIQPGDWYDRLIEELQNAGHEIEIIRYSILGKTGNPDAEHMLSSLWGDIVDRMSDMVQNPPDLTEMVWDRLSSLAGYAQEKWQDFSAWTISSAGDVLEDYHESVQEIQGQRNALRAAMVSGQFSAEDLAGVEAAITNAEGTIAMIRDIYRVASSGGSIDQVAQEMYGPYASLGQLQAVAIIAVAVVLAFLVGVLVGYRRDIAKSLEAAGELVAKGGEKLKEALQNFFPSLVGHSGLSIGLIAGGASLLIFGGIFPSGLSDIARIAGLGLAGYGTYKFFTEKPKPVVPPAGNGPAVHLLPGETAASYA